MTWNENNIYEWERLNAETNKRDRDSFARGLAWAALFGSIFWGSVALWCAL